MSGSITRREFLETSAATLAAAATASGQVERRPPNVLFVFSDQQHAGTVSAYGGTPVRTPHVDRLAREGCLFDNAISIYPVCSPYRGMLMSGLYPMRNGVVANDTPLSDGLPTFGKLFQQAGYRTGYMGKWHLEASRAGFVRPERRQGFEYWAAHSCSHEHFEGTFFQDDPDQELRHPGYEPDSQTRMAIDFMADSMRRGQPFCLAVSYGPPHSPYKAPEKYEERYRPEADIPLAKNVAENEIVEELLRTDNRPLTARQKRSRERYRNQLNDDQRLREGILRGYYGACEALDDCVGRLLKALDDFHIAGDTIVVYTSDHGDMVGSHRMLSKQLPFEESLRVPFLVRYPGEIPGGPRTQTLLTPIDILPTLLSLAGIPYDPETFDGRDVGPYAWGKEADDREAVLTMKMGHGGQPWIMNGVRPWRGVRTNRYSYAELEGSPWLLYDIQEDPNQLHNLIGDAGRAGVRTKLQKEMRRLMQEAGDELTEEQIDEFRREQIRRFPA